MEVTKRLLPSGYVTPHSLVDIRLLSTPQMAATVSS